MTYCDMFEAKTHFSQLVEELVSGRTDCVRVSRRGTPIVQITVIRDVPPTRSKLGIAKGKFRLPTWEEDKAMDREIARHAENDCQVGRAIE